MKKVLFVATVDSHIKQFHLPYLKWFKKNGFEVHVATNSHEPIEYCDKKHCITFERNPFKKNNITAIIELKRIIEEEKIQIIHCHTPVGAAISRISAKNARKTLGTKVIYTAHGFHFYKGASLKNWILYYPIEKILAKSTDCIITINQEDYKIAKNKLKAKKIAYVNGVGIVTDRLDVKFNKDDKKRKREELGISQNDTVLTYVAELNDNKNQKFLIEIVDELVKEQKNVTLLLVGEGKNKLKYQNTIEQKGLKNNIKILGYRKDIGEILSITDICTASSLREGLPVNVLECMYMSIPVIAIDNRGHKELVQNGENGYIIPKLNKILYKEKVKELADNPDLRKKMGKKSKEMSHKYTIENIIKDIEKIYKEMI